MWVVLMGLLERITLEIILKIGKYNVNSYDVFAEYLGFLFIWSSVKILNQFMNNIHAQSDMTTFIVHEAKRNQEWR